jgi:hypothetical protein
VPYEFCLRSNIYLKFSWNRNSGESLFLVVREDMRVNERDGLRRVEEIGERKN